MELRHSAFKHGVLAADTMHAFRQAIRIIEFEYDHERRLLVIGPDRSGRMLELVAVPSSSPITIIHSDRLRPKFYDYLR